MVSFPVIAFYMFKNIIDYTDVDASLQTLRVVLYCFMFGVFIICLKNYLRGTTYDGKGRLDNKTVVITGANSGIGKEIAKDLTKRGARVILACRDLEKARAAMREIKETQGFCGTVDVYHLDLASISSIRKFVETFNDSEERLDVLINNAGVLFCPYLLTEDGFEMHLGVNHLGHFLLTNLLLDKLKKSAPSRVITVSSYTHSVGKINFEDINSKNHYDAKACYNQSKLANILFTKELSKRLKGSGVTTYCLHPGVSRTNIGRHLWDQMPFLRPIFYLYSKLPLFKNSKEGAQTAIYCAVDEALGQESGKYYRECRETIPARQALDDGIAKKLWEISEKMVGLNQDHDKEKLVEENSLPVPARSARFTKINAGNLKKSFK